MQVVLDKILMMFLILAVGLLCFRTRIFDETTLKRLSTFLLQVVNPAVIFVSYQMSYTRELLVSLGYAFVLSVAAFLIQIVVAYAVVRKKGVNSAVERLSIIYSNCGYFGIPLASGLFGKEGVFYLTSYLTVFSLFFWTQGVVLMIGKTNLKETIRNLVTPAIIGVILGMLCFVLQIRLPSVFLQTLDSLGSMNTPLAMLIAGASLGRASLRSCFLQRRVYLIALYRLILVPFAVIFAFSFTTLDAVMVLTIILAAASPVAVGSTMFALRYEKDSLYASQLFITTTLLAIFSIPLVVWFARVMGI
ncbi:MAG: AEC family transporter [Sphaerochaeta sp.]|uniref:AEC family transporter n=1 Tax=Sphaerochaeta sp. TaxID=1972642 RepID=UPI002FC8F77E